MDGDVGLLGLGHDTSLTDALRPVMTIEGQVR